MPFSIKRFTQLHRSSSLPNKNKQEDNKCKKKCKEQSSLSTSSTSQPISQHKQKLSNISASRSIDAAEIRRLGGQLTISNPIPIDQPQVTNTLPIRWSKTGPHSGHRNAVQQQESAINRSGYYSDAEDLRSGQQRRVLTLIRPNGQQVHALRMTQMAQPLPNLALLKSGGTHSGHSTHASNSSLQSLPQSQHTQPAQPLQQLNQQILGDGSQRTRGGQEILINGGQRSRQPRRHHTIATTEHFNNVMNQTSDNSASEIHLIRTTNGMILSKIVESTQITDNRHISKVSSSPTSSLSTNLYYTNGMSRVLQHLQYKYPEYNIVKSYYEGRLISSSARSSSGSTTGPQRPSNPNPHPNLHLNANPHHTTAQAQPQRPASATPLERGLFLYQPPSSLFDDDPGIMSEIETSATGFRRGNKVRSSLPIVRTPSKTQDRSLGLVFLQFRTETKRALLPNEITSLDTVKALFVRSFPRQLSMEYLDCTSIRIYIHDASKDMFYELEDLRDIRDRCVLRIYEHGVNGPQPVGGHANLPIPWTDSEQFGYFSEPEFESEYQSQHVHKAKRVSGQLPTTGGQSQYYGTIILPAQYRSQTMTPRNYAVTGSGQPPQPPERSKPYPGYSQTLPRGTHIMSLYGNLIDSNTNNTNQNQTTATSQTQRSVSPDLIQKRPKEPIGMPTTGPPPKPQRSFSSQSRSSSGVTPPRSVTSPSGTQYHLNRPLPDRPYSVAGQYPSPEKGRAYQQDFSGYLSSPERRMPQESQTQVRSSFSGYPSMPFEDPYGIYGMRSGSATPVIDEEARVRMQAMERQLVSLTNVVTKALTPAQIHSQKSDEESDVAESNQIIENCISNAQMKRQQFKEEKSVSFSDETSSQLDQLMHSPQRAAERPVKPAIKSRTTLTDKCGKPAPPPKPASLVGYRGEAPIGLSNDMFTQLRQIRKKTKDLRGEVRALRRMALQQTNSAKEALRETCNKIKTTLGFLSTSSDCQLRLERMKISHERDSYGEDVSRLDKDLQELESQVEELRSNVINRRCRVNMSNVESMALVLSRASKTVADLKNRFPQLSQTLKSIMSQEMEYCVKEEKFLKEEPDRLETALKRCKKLTGTLVTLKRLASVQEQRSTTNANSCSPSSQLLQSSSADTSDRDITSRSYDSDMEPHTIIHVTPATPLATDCNKTNVLDTLLDELQTFSKPSSQSSTASIGGQSSRKSVQSMTSVDSVMAKKGSTIPAPPPRSSSVRINPSVLSSFAVRPPSYAAIRSNSEPPPSTNRPRSTPPEGVIPDGDDAMVPPSSSTSSLSSVGSQGSVVEKRFAQSRQELLEQRHQELLKKQKQLQEQYTRLQQLSRGQIPRGLLNDLKKTGSESNIVSKTSFNLNAVHGSLRDLANKTANGVIDCQQKIFETDIL